MRGKAVAVASVSGASVFFRKLGTAAKTVAIMAAKLAGCGYCLAPALYAQYVADVDTLSKVSGWGFVIVAAIAFKFGLYSLRRRNWADAAAALALWAVLGVLSMINASGSISATGGGARVRHASVQKAEILRDETRTHLRTQRTQRTQVVGETPVSQLTLALQQVEQRATVADPKRWRATQGCADGYVTVPQSVKFCEPVLEARAKVKAGEERDQIDKQLKPLDDAVMAAAMTKKGEAQEKTGEVRGDPEAFANNVMVWLVMLGYDVTEKHRPLIHAAREWGQAAGIELQATMGPAIVIGFIDIFVILFGPASRQPAPVRASVASVPAPERKGWISRLWRRREKPAVTAPAQPVPPATTDAAAPVAPKPAAVPRKAAAPVKGKLKRDVAHIEQHLPGFIEACLDTSDPKAETEPTPLWKRWQEHCKAQTIEPTTQKAFGTALPRHFELIGVKDKRRRYVGVKLKPAAPARPMASVVPLRAVS
jgi:hypothetical protein